jgi:hypothetical protein
MRGTKVFLLLSLMLVLALPIYALDDPKVAHAKYDELAAKVHQGDLNIDWQALRLAARVGKVYGDYDPYDAAKRAQASFEKETLRGLRIAQETERHNVADGDAHVAAWSCLKNLGRQREADKEWSILQALLQSILKSGDGKSAKTAWLAVGIREEYLVMEAVLQVQIKEQRSVKQDGHYYDMVLVTDQSGKDAVLWFNIDTDIELGIRAGDEGHHIY